MQIRSKCSLRNTNSNERSMRNSIEKVVGRLLSVIGLVALRQKGYTLIEMMVVIFIISILMGTTLYNYSRQSNNEVLLFEAQKLAQFLRRAQNLALSPQSNDAPLANGFGVRVSKSTNSIFLFSDKGALPNYIYDPAEKIEELVLDPRISVGFIQAPAVAGQSQSVINILYIPPDPVLKIYTEPSMDTGANNAEITLVLKSDITKERKIRLNLVGLVEVQ